MEKTVKKECLMEGVIPKKEYFEEYLIEGVLKKENLDEYEEENLTEDDIVKEEHSLDEYNCTEEAFKTLIQFKNEVKNQRSHKGDYWSTTKEQQRFNLMAKGSTLNNVGTDPVKDEIIFRKIQESAFPKVLLHPLNNSHKVQAERGPNNKGLYNKVSWNTSNKKKITNSKMSTFKVVETDSTQNEETLLRRIQGSTFPMVLLHRLNISNKEQIRLGSSNKGNGTLTEENKYGDMDTEGKNISKDVPFEKTKESHVSQKSELYCSLCSFKTQEKDSLKNHMFSHSNSKKFQCSKCSFESNHKGYLKIHLLNHEQNKLFKCSLCSYECNQKYYLKIHIQSHTGVKLFKCCKCEFKCNRKDILKRHVFRHAKTKLFKCLKCSYACNSESNLKSHMLRHVQIKLFKCSQCSYQCNQKSSLKIHLLNHKGIKLFKCSQCNYGCNKKAHLISHILTHEENKSFKCSKCTYGSNHQISLKIHMLNHEGIKMFKCTQCSYECNHKGNFKTHIRIHSEKKI